MFQQSLGENRNPSLLVRSITHHKVRFRYHPPCSRAETLRQLVLASVSWTIEDGIPPVGSLSPRPANLTDNVPYLEIGFLPAGFPTVVNPVQRYYQPLGEVIDGTFLTWLNDMDLNGICVTFANGLSEYIIDRPPTLTIRQQGGSKTKRVDLHGYFERRRQDQIVTEATFAPRKLTTNLAGRFVNPAEWTITFDEAKRLMPNQYLGSLRLNRGIDKVYAGFRFSRDAAGKNCLHNGWYSIPFQRPRGSQWNDPAFRLIRPLRAIPLFAWQAMLDVAEGCDLEGLLAHVRVPTPDDGTHPLASFGAEQAGTEESEPLNRMLYRAGARELAFVGPFMVAKGIRKGGHFWIVDTNVSERALRIFRNEQSAMDFAVSGTGWLVPNTEMIARVIHRESEWTGEVDQILLEQFGPECS